ncbi:MAG: hypothetical protein GEU83_01540 [Pseudonocardiaceae bacterium]|nr:hypothetical protein [Pseudonocardiaceae bacterium]
MRLNATAASKGFSNLLSRVGEGESVEIERHGQTVAVLVPPQRGYLSGAAVLELLDHLPAPDAGFGDDITRLAETLVAPVDPWQY